MYDLKIGVSCEASVNFQHMSQKAAPATEFARCHHLTQPWQCDSQKTHNTTRLEVLRLPRKMNTDTPKVLHVPRKMKVIFWKRCKVLPLQDKTSFNMLWNMLDCHKVPRLPRQTRLRDVWTSKSDDFGRTHHIGMAIRSSRGRLPTVANGCGRLHGCGRLRTVAQRLANTASTPKPGTLATHSGKGKNN